MVLQNDFFYIYNCGDIRTLKDNFKGAEIERPLGTLENKRWNVLRNWLTLNRFFRGISLTGA